MKVSPGCPLVQYSKVSKESAIRLVSAQDMASNWSAKNRCMACSVCVVESPLGLSLYIFAPILVLASEALLFPATGSASYLSPPLRIPSCLLCTISNMPTMLLLACCRNRAFPIGLLVYFFNFPAIFLPVVPTHLTDTSCSLLIIPSSGTSHAALIETAGRPREWHCSLSLVHCTSAEPALAHLVLALK